MQNLLIIVFFIKVLFIPLMANCYEVDMDGAIITKNAQDQRIYKINQEVYDPFEYARFCKYGQGKILILLGTSTSGKTTLIEAIKEINPAYLDYSIDLRFCNWIANKILLYCPNEYKILKEVIEHQHLAGVVLCNDSNKFKKTLSFQQSIVESAIEVTQKKLKDLGSEFTTFVEHTCNEIIQQSLAGNSVIMDAVSYEYLNCLFSYHFCAPIQLRLVFCPLEILSERMSIRNKKARGSGDYSNVRDGFPLWQYTNLYKRENENNSKVLEMITRQQACDIFDKYLIKEENTQEEKERKQRDEFLESLGFSNDSINEVYMTSRFTTYDGEPINTSTLTPGEWAKRIQTRY